jgi:hypothetical protein
VVSLTHRKNPFMDPPPITDNDLNRGVFNLQTTGLIPRDVDVGAAFRRGNEPLSVRAMSIMLVQPSQLKFLNHIPHEPIIKLDWNTE